jgi:NAD(P)H-dependent flavin oxidoreductase YrpB (nitropropane dioxygenase family)
MAGAPRHVTKALEVGVDIICATGGEGGAHSGDISTVVLLPQCAGKRSCSIKIAVRTARFN